MADLAPVEEGVNLRVIVSGRPPEDIVNVARPTENWEASAPVTEIPAAVSAALPLLDTVNVNVLLWFTWTSPNVRDVLETVIIGPKPFPEKGH